MSERAIENGWSWVLGLGSDALGKSRLTALDETRRTDDEEASQ
ncbi:hypothetical protein [Actinocorallia libanotica]|uniref:Uncharacterized protein n=1 Tax=Actinocorallia libanotica TaxID=46162 RepID=A0ABN1QQJ4_9ACTN